MKKALLLVCSVALLTCGGCHNGELLGLKFAPSEAQKGVAEVTHTLACQVDEEGTTPRSETSRKLVEGTGTGLAYIGRPSVLPDPAQFDSLNDEARSDLENQSGIGGALDVGLSLGLMVAGLFGGAGGIRLASHIRNIHAKAKGFVEVVRGAELFNKMATYEEWEKFKKAQLLQTDSTRKLVADEKIEYRQVDPGRVEV